MSIQLSASSLGDNFKYYENAESQSECESVDNSVEEYVSLESIKYNDSNNDLNLKELEYSKTSFYFTSLSEEVSTPPPQLS